MQLHDLRAFLKLGLMARQASRYAKFVMPFGAFGFRTKDGQRICLLWGAFEKEIN